MSAKYAWIITKDLLAAEFDAPSRVGTIGPRNATDDYVARLRAGQGQTFRLLDDDGEVIYRGRIIYPSQPVNVFLDSRCDVAEQGFEPLDDFGAGDAGCTEIQYYNTEGRWQTL